MRIGINTLFLIPGEVGGSETYFCEVFAAMTSLYPGDEFVLFTQIENDPYLRERFGGRPNVSFMKLPFRAVNRFSRIVREQAQLPWRVRKAKVHVLWSPGYTAPILCCVPQVLSILDMQYRRFPEDLSWLARVVTDVLLKLGVWRIRSILTISAFSKAEIIHFLKVEPDRVTVTRLAASEAFCDSGFDALPDALAGDASVNGYILCVANTYPHKNIHTLVAAFGRTASEHSYSLVLVGKARLGEKNVQEALEDLPLQVRARMIRLERVSFAQLVALYRRCVLFVCPSLYEGFGLPVIEAIYAGAKVVASDIPAHQEVGGRFVRYTDAGSVDALCEGMVRALVDNHAGADRHAALDWCRSFSWQSAAALTQRTLYRAVDPSPIREG